MKTAKTHPMRFYVIPPVSALELIDEGDDVFVLAHLFLKDEGYRDFMLKKKAEGRFITLDNSAAERALVSQEDLLKCVEALKPNEVVAPDVLFNTTATIKNLLDFIRAMEEKRLLKDTKIFFCPQGLESTDWMEAYMFGVTHPQVSTIGMSKIAIPRAYFSSEEVLPDQRIAEARIEVTNYLFSNDLLRKPLHYLGAGDPREFAAYDNPLLRSTDSCFSVWSAMCGKDWQRGSAEDFERVPTPHDYFERTLTPEQIQLAKSNIQFLKQVTK